MKFIRTLKKVIGILKQTDVSGEEKLDFVFSALIDRLRVNHFYFMVRALRDSLIIKKNPLAPYRMKHLVNGLKDTNKINPITDKSILRIVDAYIKAKNDQVGQPRPYQIEGEWERLLMKSWKDLKIEFEKKNINKVKAILANFARDKISLGFQLYGATPLTIIDKLGYLNWINKSYYNWKKLTALSDKVLEYPKEIGNLPGVEINGKLIPIWAFRLSYFANKICNLLKSIDHPIIIEIGGGLGGIPYHIFKHNNLKCTYINFDIPEICVIASYFLMSNFPNKKILLYGELNMGNISLGQYDIIIMPNYAIKDLPEKCCDLVFNSHSLGEMDWWTVKEYLGQVDRVSKRYFLHTNDERKLIYLSSSGKLKRRPNLNNFDLELPRESFKRIYRIPEIIYNDGAGGYSKHGFDRFSFEYLYERIDSVLKMVES